MSINLIDLDMQKSLAQSLNFCMFRIWVKYFAFLGTREIKLIFAEGNISLAEFTKPLISSNTNCRSESCLRFSTLLPPTSRNTLDTFVVSKSPFSFVFFMAVMMSRTCAPRRQITLKLFVYLESFLTSRPCRSELPNTKVSGVSAVGSDGEVTYGITPWRDVLAGVTGSPLVAGDGGWPVEGEVWEELEGMWEGVVGSS